MIHIATLVSTSTFARRVPGEEQQCHLQGRTKAMVPFAGQSDGAIAEQDRATVPFAEQDRAMVPFAGEGGAMVSFAGEGGATVLFAGEQG